MSEIKLNFYGMEGVIDHDNLEKSIDAKRLISQYKKSNRIIYLEGNGEGPMIEGFSFPVSELQELINQGNEGPNDRVYFALGYHESEEENDYTSVCGPPSTPLKKGYTLIAYTMDQNCNLTIDLGKKIFDYCDPCPPRCPSNI